MLVIPINSVLYNKLKSIAQNNRMVFMTGLLGTGKTLMIQQLALLAHEAKRNVHFLQYDIARQAFETFENLAKYPEKDGVTHPAIRKALGLWVRNAVLKWHTEHPNPKDILIAELPLIGNRLLELAEIKQDALEPILSSKETLFTIPIPSWEVREVIEERRQSKFENNQEQLDSAPNVLRDLWQEVNSVARQIGLTKTKPDTPYNPYIYGGVYEALLKNRHVQTLILEQIYQPKNGLAQDVIQSQLKANPEQVKHYLKEVETSYTQEQLEQNVNKWHASITQNPKLPDAGPELSLPLPEKLHEASQESISFALNEKQKNAIHKLMNLSLDADTKTLNKALDKVIETLEPAPNKTLANKHKFDVYDSYFNVSRNTGKAELSFLSGSLQAYKNILNNLESNPNKLTVVELPMLRLALETTLRQFDINTNH